MVFTPPATDSDSSEPTSKALRKRIGTLTNPGSADAIKGDGTCPPEWQFYCEQIYETADFGLKHGKRLLVVTEPYISDQHVRQQRALAAMLNQRFGVRADFVYVNLGRTIDLQDKSLCWDGMHLTAEGNRRIAAALIEPVLDVLKK